MQSIVAPIKIVSYHSYSAQSEIQNMDSLSFIS